MFGSFAAIQFTGPALLLGAFAVPLLILAYLRKQNRKRQIVSSVLILEKLSKRRLLQHRFKPPLRFFLELAALLLLVLSAAGPAFKDERQQIALVLDSSLSMRARSGDFSATGSRFEEARKALSAWIASQRKDSAYTVFVSAPKLRQLGDNELSAERVAAALSEAAATVSTDTLDASVSELAQTGSYDKVLVVTDRKAQFSAAPTANEGQENQKQTTVDVLSVGKPSANLYLADLRIVPADVAGAGSKVSAAVGFSGVGEIACRANLYLLDASGAAGSAMLSVSAHAYAGKLNEVVFNLPQGVQGEQVYKVEVAPAAQGQQGSQDAITEDNYGWVSAKGTASAQLLLVTPRESTDALGLAKISTVHVVQIRPEDYAKLDSAGLEQYALLVFDEAAPALAPKRPTLLIVPPAENQLFPVAGEFQNGRIASWAGEHPITSYLRFELLAPGAGVIFAVPNWAQAVINAEPGAIVVAGESRGVRFAGVGMEILPFEGAKTPALSILTLNMVNWLMGGTELTSSLLTGTSLRLEGGKSWEISTPRGNVERIEVARGETSYYTLEQAGPYHLLGRSVENAAAAKEDQSVMVNSFFPLESATAVDVPLVVPQLIIHETVKETQSTPLWPYLVGLVLTILTVELLIPAAKEAQVQ
jgi:hypothetical protein